MHNYLIINKFWNFAFAMFFVLGLQAQSIHFEASVDSRQVALSDYVEVSFTLQNASIDGSFYPPSFPNFKIVSGPNQSVSTAIINGARSSSFTYSYVLKPQKIGTLTIGAAKVTVKGQTFTTRPISVEVVKSAAPPPVTTQSENKRADGKFFIRAETSTKEATVGSLIILDYKLYTTVNIDNYEINKESDYSGFFAQEIRALDNRATRETIGGVQYTCKILKRVALFPQQIGVLSIEPATLNLAVIMDDSPQHDIFFFPETKIVSRQTNDIKLKINELPNNAPATFSGGVGKYEITSNINKTNLTTDESITLQLNIAGQGDIKRIQAPKLVVPDSFEVYEPRTIEDNSQEMGGVVVGRKSFEYTILPKKAGHFELNPFFTYFDTDTLKYITLSPQTYSITVTQGENKINTNVATNDNDFRYIKTTTNFDKIGKPFWGSLLYWVLSFIPLAVLGGAVWWKQKEQKKLENIDPIQQKMQLAQKVAQQRLTTAKTHLTHANYRAFFDETTKAMQGYLSDKFQLPMSAFSKNLVEEKLQAKNVEPTIIQRLKELLQTCEIALYAGKANEESATTTYNEANSLMVELERIL